MNRILIVDDKAENLYLLRMLLQGHGHQVDEAQQGLQALARAHPPDLIISDLLMPEMDGYALLQAWKGDARLRVIPFVVYTATYTDTRAEQLACDLGADAFLVKPTEPADFVRRVEAVLERARQGDHALPRRPAAAQPAVLRSYNELLVRKLEQRTLQLERHVRELRETERVLRERERELAHQANHDALTGLANRNLLEDRVAVTIAYALRGGRSMALLFIDLDQFKRVNDSLGHAFGDAVLHAAAQRITGCLRDRDTAARLGGDEFVVVLADMARPEDVSGVVHKLLQAIAQPLVIGAREVALSASIGAAVYPQDGTSYASLLRNADTAMYRAKDAGRNCARFYTVDMNAGAVAALELETRLRHALEHGELRLHYQPLLDVASGRVRGAEALLRWARDGDSLLLPDSFLAIAEQSGLIVPIGHWVLAEACRQVTAWAAEGLDALDLAINLSPQQLREPGLPARIRTVLEDTGLPAARLVLELTETAVTGPAAESSAVLAALRQQGIRVAVDDFAAGHASLTYLRRFAVDQLKIDRSFIQSAHEHADHAAILHHIVGLARSLKLQTVAEGVETPAQHALLRASGCELVQGFLFSAAVPPEQFVASCQSILGAAQIA